MEEVSDLPLVMECDPASYLFNPLPSPGSKLDLDPSPLNLHDVPGEEERLIREVLLPHLVEERVMLPFRPQDDEPPPAPDIGSIPLPLVPPPHPGRPAVRDPIGADELLVDPLQLLFPSLLRWDLPQGMEDIAIAHVVVDDFAKEVPDPLCDIRLHALPHIENGWVDLKAQPTRKPFPS